MKATLVLRRREVLPGGLTLVRYDNETGKGDHKHYGRKEERYAFVSMERLIEDFIADIERLGDGHG